MWNQNTASEKPLLESLPLESLQCYDRQRSIPSLVIYGDWFEDPHRHQNPRMLKSII